MKPLPRDYPAPAKLNLFLRVVGRRADGYHLLQTVFRLLDYGDTLSFEVTEAPTITLARPLPGVPEDRDLCVRAARLLQQRSGCRRGARIAVEKKLPLGGGLGGGSSDAATTLLALNRLWGMGWSRQRLQDLALELGADVPVFVFGQAAFGEGIGERLTAIDLPPAWYLVLMPPVAVATREVFASPALTRNALPIRIAAFSRSLGRNDLEPVVCGLHPEVEQHLAWLRQFGPAALTGSGACVYCPFATEGEAREALARLPKTMAGFVAQGLDRHPLWDLTD